jgi:hypothetical protein
MPGSAEVEMLGMLWSERAVLRLKEKVFVLVLVAFWKL